METPSGTDHRCNEISESCFTSPFDVLSFQDFRDPAPHLDEWHKKTSRPVLLADAAGLIRPDTPEGFTRNDGEWYADVLAALFDNPGCIGFHLCGAYQRNKARRRGLLDEMERPAPPACSTKWKGPIRRTSS